MEINQHIFDQITKMKPEDMEELIVTVTAAATISKKLQSLEQGMRVASLLLCSAHEILESHGCRIETTMKTNNTDSQLRYNTDSGWSAE